MRALAALAATTATVLTLAGAPLASQRSAPRGSVPPGPPAPAASRRTETPVPFKVGEVLTYDVSWSSFIVAGTAVATVVEKKASGNSIAYSVVADGRPVPLVARLYSVYYKMESTIDAYGLLSQRGSLYTQEDTDRRTTSTRFDRPARRAFFEERTDTTVTGDFAVPPQTQDGLAVFYALRARTFKTGDHLIVPIVDSGALFTIAVNVGAPEAIHAPMGQVTAWKLDLAITDHDNKPVWQDLVVWISNDARRLPVKLQAKLPIGSFVLTLRDVR